LSSSIAKYSDRKPNEIAKGLCYLIKPLVSIAALETIQITFNKPTIARATAPPKPTSISLAAPVAAEPVFVVPESVVAVATPSPLGVTKDVVLNVPVIVQEQLVSKKAEV
jgi:hypothetical protein